MIGMTLDGYKRIFRSAPYTARVVQWTTYEIDLRPVEAPARPAARTLLRLARHNFAATSDERDGG